MEELLHIYSQGFWHDEAIILGDKKALENLKAAIDQALISGVAETQAFVNDGEGFTCYVVMCDEEISERLAVPYIDEIAMEERNGAVWPHELLRQQAEDAT